MHKKTKGKKQQYKSKVNRTPTEVQDNSSIVKNNELQKRVDEFNASYSDYNQIFISYYNKNRYVGTNKAENEQFARELLRLNKSMLVLTRFIETNDKSNFAHGPLCILEIKFIILLSQFYLAFDQKKNIELESTAILAWVAQEHNLKYQHDVEFQEVIYYALSSLDDYYYSGLYAKNHLDLLPVLAKSCSGNIFKLTSLYKYYFPDELHNIENIDRLSASDKQDFEVIYSNTVLSLQQLREQKMLGFKSAWMYLKANLIIHKFKSVTHQSSLWYWRNFKNELAIHNYKKISEEEFRKSFNLFCEWSVQYIEPTSKIFLEIDWKQLKKNAKWIVEVKELFMQWPAQILNNLNLFAKWIEHYNDYFETRDLWDSILDEMQKQVGYFLNIMVSFDRYKSVFPKNPLGLTMEKETKGIKEVQKFIHVHDIALFATEIGEVIYEHRVNEHSKKFIASLSAEAKEAERHRADIQQKKMDRVRNNSEMKQHHDSSSEDAPKKQTITKPPSPSELQLTNAYQWMSQKKHNMAIQSYQLALALAEKEGDLHQQLKAMDGLGAGYALQLSPKLVDLHSMLTYRISNIIQPLNKNARLNLVQSIDGLGLDYDIIVANFEKFKILSKQEDILKIKEIESGIEYTNNKLVGYLIQFQSIITEIKWLCYELVDACQRERYRFLMELGTKEKPDGTDFEKFEAGLAKFGRIGNINNQKNQAQYSDYTLDLDAFTKVAAKLNTFKMAIVHPAIRVNLPKAIADTFGHLNGASDGHFLVGSTVINLVLQFWNQPLITTHDLDFITAYYHYDKLRQKGYFPDKYIANLYVGHFLNEKVELYCLENEEHWLMKSLLTRPFTITALYCDHNGYIVDPTNQGLQDLHDRCIRMIGIPTIRLNQDPIIALLIIKYMQLGFKLEENLQRELYQWAPASISDQAHLYAVGRTHLKQYDEIDYLTDLIKFGLLSKLFQIEHYDDLNETLHRFKQTVGATFDYNYSEQGQSGNRYAMFSVRTNNSADNNPFSSNSSCNPMM